MRKTNKKRVILKGLIALLVCVLIGEGVWYFWMHHYAQRQVVLKSAERPIWLSKRPMPKTVEPGAYLAALNAVLNQDLQQAAAFYLKVQQGDPENEKLQRESYFFNAILGNFEVLRPIVARLRNQNHPEFLAEYVTMGYAIQENDWLKVRQSIAEHKPLPLDKILLPLVKGWSYAATNEIEQAEKAMAPLLKEKGLRVYYYYHLGLMGLSVGNEALADSAFRQLAENKLMTFSFYPEIKAFYVRRGEWNLENPFYVQWQLFAAEQPATAELVMLAPVKFMTPIRGVAEVFYNISTALGAHQTSYESALVLSALSLYLNPQQELPKIWNAEILEQMQKPQLAAYYYDKLPPKTTQTMTFKKAMNLIACGRDEEALNLLTELQKTNRDSSPLWLALAAVYQNSHNWPMAIQAYTRILEIEGETNRSYASDIYFARAFIYNEEKQVQKAEADLEHALELNPENPMILNHLGYQWLEKEGTKEKGFDLISKAYALKKSDPHIIDSMAWAYYQRSEYEKALPLAEKTVDIMPQSSVANAHLGDIYAALGRHREALFQYNKALSLKYDLTPELKESLLEKKAAFIASSIKK